MTAVTPTRRNASRQRGLKSLAGVLTFVCVVLFMLAIEQKHAVEAWNAVRDGAIPAAQRVTSWVSNGAANGVSGLKDAAQGDVAQAAATGSDQVLAGEFSPADDATREAVGGVTFVQGRIQFESGDVLHTRPLRIAAGRDAFQHGGQTFAARLDAPQDAQIELRQIVPAARAGTVPVSDLCGGEAPGVAALLHRRDRVDVMLFRERTIVGAAAMPSALCGVWSFRAR